MAKKDDRELRRNKSREGEVRGPSDGTSVNPKRWGLWPRRVASIAIVFHLIAVIAEPFHFFTRSPVRAAAVDARLIRANMAPYVDFMFLSHGYFFFAPNPGPNHLIRCELTPEGGQPERTEPLIIEFPDRKKHWPRLLYHRHFMLSEFYNNMFAPAEVPIEAESNPRARADWAADRERYTRLQTDILRNLQNYYPNHTITLRRVAHLQPSEEQFFQEHWKLTDPRLYTVLPETLDQANEPPIPLRSAPTPPVGNAGQGRNEPPSPESELIPLGVPQGSER